MGIFDRLRNELIDIIEWNEPNGSDTLAYRFPRFQNEIKNGAMLVVREGQVACFVNEGQLADVFPPGTHRLETQNMPILSTLKGWKYGFNSPFKAEVYFISTKQWTDLKWGTQNPIMMRDPELGPVRIRAFGSYAMRVQEPATFLKQLVATDPSFEAFEIAGQLRNMIVSRFADVVGQAKLPILELAGNYERLGKLAMESIAADVATMGLKLTLFYIENVSLPPEVEAALDTRSKMSLLGNLNDYTKFQAADAIRDAAKNEGGFGGMGAGLGAGMAVGNAMAGAIGSAFQQPQAAPPSTGHGVPPPMPTAVSYFVGINGAQAGPFDLGALAAKVSGGEVKRESLVWKQGMAAWAAADSVAELQGLFAHSPPPLPS